MAQADLRTQNSYPADRRGGAPAPPIPRSGALARERGDAPRRGERFLRSECLLTAAILLLLALSLSIIAAGPNTLPGDIALGRWIQSHHSAPLDVVAWVGNFIGEGRIVFTAAIAMVLYSSFLRLWRDVRFLTMLVVLRLVSLVLKGIFESPRPTADDLRLAEVYEDFGYPSGHATSATVLAGAFIVLILRRVHSPALRRAGLVACVLIPVITGFARVYVGAHWPSDVLGGYLWGTIIALLAVDLSRRLPFPRQ